MQYSQNTREIRTILNQTKNVPQRVEQVDKTEANQKGNFSKAAQIYCWFPKRNYAGPEIWSFFLKLEALNPSSNLPA